MKTLEQIRAEPEVHREYRASLNFEPMVRALEAVRNAGRPDGTRCKCERCTAYEIVSSALVEALKD